MPATNGRRTAPRHRQPGIASPVTAKASTRRITSPASVAGCTPNGYAGFEDLYRSGTIREVACMAHVRRKFVDIHRSQGSPIAEEAIGRIAQLYAVERDARGSPPDLRVELRKAHAAPVFDDLEAWLAMQLTTISGKSPLAAAIRYALTRMERMRPYLDHGILELDTDVVEQPLSQPFRGFSGLSVQALTMAA